MLVFVFFCVLWFFVVLRGVWMSELIIELKCLCCDYFLGDGVLMVLKDVDLMIMCGEMVVIVGFFGLGKLMMV